MRKKYMERFVFRVCVLAAIVTLYFVWPDSFRVLEKGQFFTHFSPLHLLWGIWLVDMVIKLAAPRGHLSLGAVKPLRRYYEPSEKDVSREELKSFVRGSDRRSVPVFLLWVILGGVLAVFRRVRLLSAAELFLVSVMFYVCDLICVLFWCPFRVFFLHNRCCTTCPIFNWDHLMMTTPLISIGSFFSWTLVDASIFMFLLWEVCFHRHPERFWERANRALMCANCKGRLCGQKQASKTKDV